MLDLKLCAGNGRILSRDTAFSGAADCTDTYRKTQCVNTLSDTTQGG
jgi:hypothetical protein